MTEAVSVATKLLDPSILGSSALSQFESKAIMYRDSAPPLVIASKASLPAVESEEQNYIIMESFVLVT